MSRQRESAAAHADRLAFELELAMDIAASRTDWLHDGLERGIPFADFECRHGRVAGCHECSAAPIASSR